MITTPRLSRSIRAAICVFAIGFAGQGLPAYANTSNTANEVKTVKKSTEQEQFIQNLGNKAIEILASKELSPEKRDEVFRQLMRDSFDLKTIARFVLGRNWRTASKEERTDYLNLFEALVVKTYSDRFALYTGEGFIVISAKKEGKRDYIVNSEITRPDGTPSTAVSWRVRNKKGKMSILDVVVEGVSMSVTQRQEYSSVIQRNGGQMAPLLDLMRQRAGLKKEAQTQTAKNKS